MTALVIPVKTPSLAKQRLAGVLSPIQRAGLVVAMLEDVLATVDTVAGVQAWVVSNDATVQEIARTHGASVVHEDQLMGYNNAVRLAIECIRKTQATPCNVSVIPADIPLVTKSGLVSLTEPTDTDANLVRLAPAHDGKGTNGLFMSSSRLLVPAFGTDSYNRYRQASAENGLITELLEHASLAFDIDTPVDFERLCTLEVGDNTAQFLETVNSSANAARHGAAPANGNTA